jgi:hypothetical protein
MCRHILGQYSHSLLVNENGGLLKVGHHRVPTARPSSSIQRATQAGPYTVAYVARKQNGMADVASGRFHISEDVTCFLTHLEKTFPFLSNNLGKIVHVMAQTDLQSDIDAGWQTIVAASVEDTWLTKNWQTWLKFCSDAHCKPYLEHGSSMGTMARNIKSKHKP